MIEGHCLCGQARFTVDAAPIATAICHCKNCQRQGGAAFSVNLVVPSDKVALTGELKTYRDTADSGGIVLRQFCPECGSPLFSILDGNRAITIVKAGTLVDTGVVQPGVEVWCDSAQGWVPTETGRPRFAKNPPRG